MQDTSASVPKSHTQSSEYSNFFVIHHSIDKICLLHLLTYVVMIQLQRAPGAPSLVMVG
ncbi:hypothetical protein DL95DRAFT_394633 [Leptodontidium sp. 2 PMI_412]|nr:hypothetical protein DL95DRAFT_394633 [Leptodontidium sp. 2 PMI_412]